MVAAAEQGDVVLRKRIRVCGVDVGGVFGWVGWDGRRLVGCALVVVDGMG